MTPAPPTAAATAIVARRSLSIAWFGSPVELTTLGDGGRRHENPDQRVGIRVGEAGVRGTLMRMRFLRINSMTRLNSRAAFYLIRYGDFYPR